MKLLGRVLSHENSACLMIDGKIHTAIQAERLTRNKYECTNNDLAIQYCLDNASINIEDVDYIIQNCPKHYFPMRNYGKIIDSHAQNVYTISHHLAHAYASYGLSPFNEAAIMIIDGRGNFVPEGFDQIFKGNEYLSKVFFNELDEHKNWQIEVESYYYAEGSKIKLLEKTVNRGAPKTIGVKMSSHFGKFPDEFSGFYQYIGLGALYEQITEYIFGLNLEAGKVMGLAPYGNPDRFEFNMIELTKKGFCIKTDWLNLFTEPMDWSNNQQEYKDLAAKVQFELERVLTHKANLLYEKTKCKNLCVGGGVGLNSVANKIILDNTPFKNIYIQPACNDAGISMGCVFWGNNNIKNTNNSKKHFYPQVDYWGKEYDDKEILSVMNRYKNKSLIYYSYMDDIERKTAELIDQGKIIAWFQGKSEFGPRALGNRSILSDPRDKEMKDKLNSKVKFREEFRPFAPSVLEEFSQEYFDLECDSPFMLLVAKVKKDSIPAVTHIDGTARIQTVSKEQNAKYYRLIQEFFNITGIPVLLNTSFNVKGEPIVETPEEAILCFLDTGIDYLVIGNYLIEKNTISKNIIEKDYYIELKNGIQINMENAFLKTDSDINFIVQFQGKKINININELAIIRELDRKSTRLNSSHTDISRMPSSA